MRGFAIREYDGVRLLAPYDKPFIEALKGAIPSPYRTYDPESRSWRVLRPYDSTGLRVARRYYDSIVEVGEPATQTSQHASFVCLATVQRLYPDHATLSVWPDAPVDVVQAAYRVLVRQHHPDLNGSGGHQQTVAINLAYERIGRSKR